ncbi:MAG: bifunctional folylpolyglutamate synthase/dihydrofolate synthase [Paraprevotella sp.]|nr:bifunctional folylpolyglutamate synthase/dihydrofolate synthase [Paraprevotella sp.]
MTYKETTEYLFNSAPLFQHIGKEAYKEGLANTWTLDEHFGHPHRNFRCIHIAGTNGKGSCSHTLAAILQRAGYKVGLYTSPHLVDFRERIRVNGEMIPEQRVIDFVARERAFFEPLHPSFFELTTALAFLYFAECQVDVAVIEVGLGGRLDCTNIIRPDLSIITNISFDHTQFLGNTLALIAGEKAGIIKQDTPVVIGETTEETRKVFIDKAKEMNALLQFAEEDHEVISSVPSGLGGRIYQTRSWEQLEGELGGLYQEKNTNTVLCAVKMLRNLGYTIEDNHLREGFARVCELTGLRGRWQIIGKSPLILCDTGHNMGGIRYIAEQLSALPARTLRIVIGMVNDKDVRGALAALPAQATYYFTKANVKRALPEQELQEIARELGRTGTSYASVKEAYTQACSEASSEDVVFVGGSSFIVADLLSTCF